MAGAFVTAQDVLVSVNLVNDARGFKLSKIAVNRNSINRRKFLFEERQDFALAHGL